MYTDKLLISKHHQCLLEIYPCWIHLRYTRFVRQHILGTIGPKKKITKPAEKPRRPQWRSSGHPCSAIAFAYAQFHIVQSAQSAVCNFFSLLPAADDEPTLVVAAFCFLTSQRRCPVVWVACYFFSPRRVFAPGCYFEKSGFSCFSASAVLWVLTPEILRLHIWTSELVVSFLTFRRRRSFFGDLPDKPFLRLWLDAAGRIAGSPERPEATGTSGYRIGKLRVLPATVSEFTVLLLAWNSVRSNLVEGTSYA